MFWVQKALRIVLLAFLAVSIFSIATPHVSAAATPGCPTPFTPSSNNLFPFIDPATIGQATVKTKKAEYTCTTPYWHIGIVEFYLKKVAAIVTYASGATTILLLMWGGIVYIRAGTSAKPAEEGKKARGLITGAVVGFIIVIFSGFIVGGAYFIFGTSDDIIQVIPSITDIGGE